jgi:hypothetical protein
MVQTFNFNTFILAVLLRMTKPFQITHLRKVIVVPGRQHIQLTRFNNFHSYTACSRSIKTENLIPHDNKMDDKSPHTEAFMKNAIRHVFVSFE